MRHKFLIFAFFTQFLLIALMFANAYLPVLLGDEVRVRAKGYDPRDLLAGNFVLLDYGLNLSENTRFDGKNHFFVPLEKRGGLYEFGEILDTKPKDRLYVAAKRTYEWSDSLKIGAEKYFAPKEKALAIEKALNSDFDLNDIVVECGSNALADTNETLVAEFCDTNASFKNAEFTAIATLKIHKGKARIVNLELEKLQNKHLKQ